jgi:hypothetical protein
LPRMNGFTHLLSRLLCSLLAAALLLRLAR